MCVVTLSKGNVIVNIIVINTSEAAVLVQTPWYLKFPGKLLQLNK